MLTFRNRILTGDAIATLRTLPNGIADCCVTSPPYWGLRDYGVDGQIGLERTPDEFVAKIVDVFREVRRVLRDDGTLWLNLGDCYATGAGAVGDCPGGGEQGARWRGDASRVLDSYRRDREPCVPTGFATNTKDPKSAKALGPLTQPNRMPIPGLKPKDLVGIPWRVAFALQADGWFLRADIIWSKPNPMPESVKDRPTKSHEYLFLLSKSERYAYDADAIAEPSQGGASGNVARKLGGAHDNGRTNTHLGSSVPWEDTDGTRNARSVWTIPVQPFSGAHFATFPRELAERCVKAGSKQGGVVLDPFFGAGTTGLAARAHGRDYLGIELNPAYVAIAEERLGARLPLFSTSDGVVRSAAGA